MRVPPLIILGAASLSVCACSQKQAEVEIDETRELTTKDERVRLHASGWQRFRPGERHYVYEVPDGWLRRQSTAMRKLDFDIGPNGVGEVYVSETGGDLAQNVNRWRRQFGLEEISDVEVNALPRVEALGTELVLVDAEGTYAAGMGRGAMPDAALVGAIGATQSGVITIKMVGPKNVVEAERESFLEFARNLELGG